MKKKESPDTPPEKERIKQLENIIEKLQSAYFDGVEGISDAEFDLFYNELRSLSPTHPWILDRNAKAHKLSLEYLIENYRKSIFKVTAKNSDEEYDLLLNKLRAIDPKSHLLEKISGSKAELIKKDASEFSDTEIFLFHEELFWRRPGDRLIWKPDVIDKSEDFSKVIESESWQNSFYNSIQERINQLEESIRQFQSFFYHGESITSAEYDTLCGYERRLFKLAGDNPLLNDLSALGDRLEDLDNGMLRIKPKNIRLKRISWNAIDHNDPAQIRRRKSALGKKLIPLSVDKVSEKGIFRGTSRDYNVTLYNCECADFSIRGQHFPCKHIYRLVNELGITDYAELDVLIKMKSDTC